MSAFHPEGVLPRADEKGEDVGGPARNASGAGLFHANRGQPGTPRCTLGSMAVRIGVQADSRDECVEELARLVEKGYVPVMLPTNVYGSQWTARAVPAPAHPEPAPVTE